MGREAVIVSAARTPFGAFQGALRELSATDLGAVAIREAVRRAELLEQPEEVDQVLMGQVVQAGAGQIPSRQAAHKAGLPFGVVSATVNKVCASSLWAVNLADTLIRAGDAQVVVAGGMESMSNAPYLLTDARRGYRMGHGRLVDGVIHDGLWCSFGDVHMGTYGGWGAREYDISRTELDEWAYRSHMRAAAAWDRGLFADEVTPVTIRQKKGEVTVAADEPIRRDTSPEKLAALRPAFEPDGPITAGNAPGLSDGASALVIMSREKAQELGLEVLATIIAQGQHSEEPHCLHTVPARAGQQALARTGLTAADLNLVEINEAFASVTLVSTRLLGVDPDIVNVNGGAIALGHPIGASGGRILMHLIYELRRRGGGIGLAAICSGGGQGEATLIRVE